MLKSRHTPSEQVSAPRQVVHAAPNEPQLPAVAPGWQSPLGSQHPSQEAALHSGTGTSGQLESTTIAIRESTRIARL